MTFDSFSNESSETGIVFNKIDFEYVNLINFKLNDVMFVGFDLEKSNLKNAEFNQCQFEKIYFRGTNFSGTKFIDSPSGDFSIYESDMQNTEFHESSIKDITIKDSNVEGSNLYEMKKEGTGYRPLTDADNTKGLFSFLISMFSKSN